MAKGYSKDLRERAVVMVEEGESRREVARVLNLAPSTAVRCLTVGTERRSLRRNQALGTVARRSRRTSSGCLISWQEPDLTLEEIRDRLRRENRRRHQLGVALLRPPRDHVQKKSCTRLSRIDLMSLPHARS